ncbi:hypothetical protein B0F90DRAFT_1821025 [Multifurca ochricompacta]|uniref:Uncharacterized protein n=1 Tax=Multifurca ochricompacta TaxID=376703 RepID=A0AAD4LY76_9AGAM|nr:hypothetical protein B0F90DRAFT_1821025 [Multifurca ochricompacta]
MHDASKELAHIFTGDPQVTHGLPIPIVMGTVGTALPSQAAIPMALSPDSPPVSLLPPSQVVHHDSAIHGLGASDFADADMGGNTEPSPSLLYIPSDWQG